MFLWPISSITPHNPEAHYRFTGPEIYEQLQGQVDYLVAGAGSGGTFSGVMAYLKERLPSCRGVLADPVGSTLGGGECGTYSIEGIGNSFTPATFHRALVDQVVKVSDQAAFATAAQLARQEGLLVGSSSGAAVWAAAQAARQAQSPANFVIILPDGAERYLSKEILEGGKDDVL